MVGGRHMGVGAHDDARAPVEEMSHRLLLARRLGVEIHDDSVGLFVQRAGFDQIARRGEGIVEIGGHEDPAHDIGDENTRAVARLVKARTAPRRALRIVERPQEGRLVGGEMQGFALIPDVIARRHHIGAGFERCSKDILGDAETAGGVLPVHHDEIEPVILDQIRQSLEYGMAARAAHHVAQKQKSHQPRASFAVFSLSRPERTAGRAPIASTQRLRDGYSPSSTSSFRPMRAQL